MVLHRLLERLLYPFSLEHLLPEPLEMLDDEVHAFDRHLGVEGELLEVLWLAPLVHGLNEPLDRPDEILKVPDGLLGRAKLFFFEYCSCDSILETLATYAIAANCRYVTGIYENDFSLRKRPWIWVAINSNRSLYVTTCARVLRSSKHATISASPATIHYTYVLFRCATTLCKSR